MLNPGELLKQSWQILIKNFGKFLVLASIPGIISIITGGVVAMVGIVSLIPVLMGEASLTPVRYIPLIIAVVIFILIAAFMQSWGTLANIYFLRSLTENSLVTISTAFSSTRKLVFKSWWVSILTGLIITGGFSLLLIPGVIFLVWFGFAMFILVDQNMGSFSSLQASRNLISGRFRAVFGRLLILLLLLLAIGFISSLLSLIPILGDIISLLLPLFTAPLTLIYSYLLYTNLKATSTPSPSNSPNFIFGLSALLGLAVAIFTIFGLVSLSLTAIKNAPSLIQKAGQFQNLLPAEYKSLLLYK